MAGDIPSDYRYTKEHEWVGLDEATGLVTVGITAYATEKLGEIVHVELPEEGVRLEKDEAFGVVESTKAVSDLFSPLDGEVVEVNDILLDTPELVSEDPFDEGWMIRVQPDDPAALDELLGPDDYQSLVDDLDDA